MNGPLVLNNNENNDGNNVLLANVGVGGNNNNNNNNNNDFSCSCPLCRRRDDEIALALEFCGDELAADEKSQRRANRRAARINSKNNIILHRNNNITTTILQAIKSTVMSMINSLTRFFWHDLQIKEVFSFLRFMLVRIKSIFVFNTTANAELRVYALHLTYIFLPVISKALITIYEQRDLITQWWMATMRLRGGNNDDFAMVSRTNLALTSRFRAFEMNF